MGVRVETSKPRGLIRRFPWLATPSMVVALALMLTVLGLVLLVPVTDLYDPSTQRLGFRNQPALSTGPDGTLHLLGTDALGRDLLSRLVQGGQVTLLIAVSSVAFAAVLGTVLGLLAGYYGGLTERVITAMADVQLAIPRMLLVIAVVAVVGPSIRNLIFLLGITSWVLYARVIRAMSLSLREREFTQAARLFGGSNPWIIRKHILPHAVGQVIILASYDLGLIVMLEAALSYIGLGVQAPMSSWGLMVNEAEPYISSNPALVVWPGIAIFMLTASTNILSQVFTSEGSNSRELT